MQKIITLITDFGLKDSFVGVMKGVICSINPDAKLVDINHNIERHNIMQCAVNIKDSYSYFPDGTIHMAVVDPGVGSERNPIIVESDHHYFVGPDNGIFSYIFENKSSKVYKITADEYFLDNISSSFHGRDIFSPIAGHLSKECVPDKYGTIMEDYVTIDLKRPLKTSKGISGEIVYVDVFGNMMTNIKNENVGYSDEIFINDSSIGKLSSSYSEGQPDSLIAIHGSNGNIEIAINQGSAAERYETLPCVKIVKSC